MLEELRELLTDELHDLDIETLVGQVELNKPDDFDEKKCRTLCEKMITHMQDALQQTEEY